jgi:DNA-binding NarL/FixJ family response regulator
MPKVLLVEDNTHFREMLADLMTAEFPSLQIEQAATVKQAMAKVESFRPSHILMDIRLPDGDGLKLTEKIKDKYPNTIIAMLTSYDLPQYREMAIKCGADCFMNKHDASLEDIFGWVRRCFNF